MLSLRCSSSLYLILMTALLAGGCSTPRRHSQPKHEIQSAANRPAPDPPSSVAMTPSNSASTPSRSTQERPQSVPVAPHAPTRRPVIEQASHEQLQSSSTRSHIQLASLVEADGINPPATIQFPSELETSGRTLTLSELEALALDNNPAVRQAGAAAYKAMGFKQQVGLYPNPNVGYNGSQIADKGTDQHIAYIEQDIVTAGKLGQNEEVLEQEVQARLWEAETQRYRVLTDVRQRFYEALGAQRRHEVASEFEKLMERGVALAKQRKAAEEASQTEVLQSEIQLQQVTVIKQRAAASLRGVWKELVAIVGLPDMELARLDGQLPQSEENRDWEMVYLEVMEQSPELQAALASMRQAFALIQRQEIQPIPNVSLFVATGYDRGTGSSMVNTQVGVPLPIFNRNQGNISAAYASYCREQQNVERIKLSLKARLARAAQNYDSAIVSVNQYRTEILPRAQEVLNLTEQLYSAGEIDFLQVLIVRRTYFESNIAFVEAQAELAQARAFLDGILLSGGLGETSDTTTDDGLRDQSLSGQ